MSMGKYASTAGASINKHIDNAGIEILYKFLYTWAEMALQLVLQLMNIMDVNDTREWKLQLKEKQ